MGNINTDRSCYIILFIPVCMNFCVKSTFNHLNYKSMFVSYPICLVEIFKIFFGFLPPSSIYLSWLLMIVAVCRSGIKTSSRCSNLYHILLCYSLSKCYFIFYPYSHILFFLEFFFRSFSPLSLSHVLHQHDSRVKTQQMQDHSFIHPHI